MNLNKLKKAIKKSFNKDTCNPLIAHLWSTKNPALGHCIVASLTVNHFCGGKILGCKHHHHYWNILPDGEKVDITKNQFPDNTIICEDKTVSREYLLQCEAAIRTDTLRRFNLFTQRVEEYLNSVKKNKPR